MFYLQVPKWLRDQSTQWELNCCNLKLRRAFTELATNYGSITHFWFDHGNDLFLDLVDRYQPGALVLGREFISDGVPANARGLPGDRASAAPRGRRHVCGRTPAVPARARIWPLRKATRR